MRLLVIADPKLPIPPVHYGGTERIVGFLCAELERQGHEIELMAGPGSRAYGGRLWLHSSPSRSILGRAARKIRFQALSLRAVRGSDAILNFGRLDYIEMIIRLRVPLALCFQNPIRQSEVEWVLARRTRAVRFIGVSNHQVRHLQSRDRFSVIYNATDTDALQCLAVPATPPYLVFLGRITRNKGADTAIRVAKRTGMRLLLAGNVSDEPGGAEFFEETIRPQLDSQIQWTGAVDDSVKKRLLSGAYALLFPIRWPEPCAIVIAESLACGAPVIAMRCASTPEVIDHGRTGFLCDTENDLVAAVGQVKEIDRNICRANAEERFSIPVMTRAYLNVIEGLISEGATKARCGD